MLPFYARGALTKIYKQLSMRACASKAGFVARAQEYRTFLEVCARKNDLAKKTLSRFKRLGQGGFGRGDYKIIYAHHAIMGTARERERERERDREKERNKERKRQRERKK